MKRMMSNHPMREVVDQALMAVSGADRVHFTSEVRPGTYRGPCYKVTGSLFGGGLPPTIENLGTYEVVIDLESKEVLNSRRVGDFKREDFDE